MALRFRLMQDIALAGVAPLATVGGNNPEPEEVEEVQDKAFDCAAAHRAILGEHVYLTELLEQIFADWKWAIAPCPCCSGYHARIRPRWHVRAKRFVERTVRTSGDRWA